MKERRGKPYLMQDQVKNKHCIAGYEISRLVLKFRVDRLSEAAMPGFR
jgi:hypothetical protein